jgi:transposase InsO family protein
MSWNEVDVDDQRMQFVLRAASGKESMTVLCREFTISRPTGYHWRRRYREVHLLSDLRERSRRPHHSPRLTAARTEQRVIALREQTGWGAKKLHVLLAEEEIPLSVRTIHRILERHKLISEDSHGPALTRFERSEPNELWQMDTKGKYPLPVGECHPLSILDDHSRYAVGLYALSELSGEQAYPCLAETFRRYGIPQAMLMDRGTLWWSAWNGWGLTRLSVRLIEQGIRLLYGRVRHPQTQGKVERFHGTLGQAMRHRGVPKQFHQWPAALAEFRLSYNERRPHEALGMKRPVERYQRSPRSYQENVQEWEYPTGSDVRRLNSQGMLTEQGQRWFVCGALAGQRVRVERFDGKLLVSYRHMYIREIDPARRKSYALVVARNAATGEPVPVALRASCASSPDQKSKEKQIKEV